MMMQSKAVMPSFVQGTARSVMAAKAPGFRFLASRNGSSPASKVTDETTMSAPSIASRPEALATAV